MDEVGCEVMSWTRSGLEVAQEAVEEQEGEEGVLGELVVQARCLAWEHGPALHPATLLGLVRGRRSTCLTATLATLPTYQAALLLTEHHLMKGDGALAPGLRRALACLASRGQVALLGDSEGEVVVMVRDWAKLTILQRVDRVLMAKPWALNRFHIQELRSVGFSISEIIHCILIMAHFHALSGMSEGLCPAPRLPKGRSSSLHQGPGRARLARRRRPQSQPCTQDVGKLDWGGWGEWVEHLASDTDTESESDTDSDTKVTYTKERSTKPILQDGQDPLSAPGRGLERAWDDFGFPVLSCFEESAALVLDNRFLRSPHREVEAPGDLHQLWTYTQHLLGCATDDPRRPHLAPQERATVLACLHPGPPDRPPSSGPPAALGILATVWEARMQAEVLHGLEAVTQFMKS